MRYILVKDGTIQNAIELEPANLTQTFLMDDGGERVPTTIKDGQVTIARKMYLSPEGFELIQSDVGEIGVAWPLVIPTDQPA